MNKKGRSPLMASLEKRVRGKTTRWRVAWTHDGRRHRKDFSTRPLAKAFLENLSEHRQRMPADVPVVATPAEKPEVFSASVAAFLTACEVGRDGNAPLEPLTIKEYRRRLRDHVVPAVGADTPVVSLDRGALLTVRDKLMREGLARASAKKHLDLTKAVLRHALDRGVLKIDPTARLTIRPDRRADKAQREAMAIHSKDEIGAILTAAHTLRHMSGRHASTGAYWARYEVMVHLLVFAGLRMSELRGLPVAAFDPEAATLRVYQRADLDGNIGRPKSAHGFRTIHLPPGVVALVSAWVQAGGLSDGLMFGTRGGGPIEHSNLSQRMWRRVQVEAGVRILNPHSTRHFYASYLIDQGVPLKVLQESLGHHDPMFTLKVYGHLFKDADAIAVREEMAERMENALTGAGEEEDED